MSFKAHISPIGKLPGLSEAQVNQLKTLGLESTQDLLYQARSPEKLRVLAQQMKTPVRYLQKWTVLAAFAQLPSVGCQYCGLLLHSGVASIPQLAKAAPGRLHTQVRRLHATVLRRSDLCPTPDQVAQWVQEARLWVRSQ